MKINFLLKLRTKYNNILDNLDNIDNTYNEIYEILQNNSYNNTNQENQENEKKIQLINLYLRIQENLIKKENILNLLKEINNKIMNICEHEFENDYVDISLDKSQKIKYCKKCEYSPLEVF